MNFFHAVLIISLINTMISSIPELDGPNYGYLKTATSFLEVTCTFFFCIEFVLRLQGRSNSSPVSIFRYIDALCLVPGLVVVAVSGSSHSESVESTFQALAMLRVVRLLDFPYLKHEAGMIRRAFIEAWHLLAAPAYFALCVWVGTSALFLWFENSFNIDLPGHFNMAKEMTSLPEAMYWCCMFFGGTWVNVDFTLPGSLVCICYVIFGMAMLAISVGVIVEAVNSALRANQIEDAAMGKFVDDGAGADSTKLAERGVQYKKNTRCWW